MRRCVLLTMLLALVGAGSGRAATQTFPARDITIPSVGKVRVQLKVETGTFAVKDFVFVRKYCYTLTHLGATGYVLTGLNPDCSDPFAGEPPTITPSSKSAAWQVTEFADYEPADPVWFTTNAAKGLAKDDSAKLVLYTNDPPAEGELFVSGRLGTTLRHDALSYWHPDCGTETCPAEGNIPVVCRGPFDIAQAYPALPADYPGTKIAPNRSFKGNKAQGSQNVTAVSGIFCLDSMVVNGVPVLNEGAFMTCPSGGYTDPVAQSYRLIKEVPESPKCPMTYQHRIWIQHGKGVRTWWALRYTPPGTTFTLEITVRCRARVGGAVAIHKNRWTWRVTATIDSLPHVIQVLHTGAVGTMEIPCIPGENTYLLLQTGVQNLKKATTRRARQDAIFDLEALIIASALFAEKATPSLWGTGFPPGNAAVPTKAGWIGILETIENPCACKLIADVDYIGRQLGIL
jgi:hypothetical protein